MTGHFWKDVPTDLPEELIEVLISSGSVRIERIVSTGQCSLPDFWYDQPEQEWVLLLSGRAVLEVFEGESESPLEKTLQAGQSLLIPAHQKHRVAWTSPEEPTVWLAIFFPAETS